MQEEQGAPAAEIGLEEHVGSEEVQVVLVEEQACPC